MTYEYFLTYLCVYFYAVQVGETKSDREQGKEGCGSDLQPMVAKNIVNSDLQPMVTKNIADDVPCEVVGSKASGADIPPVNDDITKENLDAADVASDSQAATNNRVDDTSEIKTVVPEVEATPAEVVGDITDQEIRDGERMVTDVSEQNKTEVFQQPSILPEPVLGRYRFSGRL